MENNKVHKFLKYLLDKSSIQPIALFSDVNYTSKDEDYLLTLLTFMQARCIIRNAINYSSNNVYVFSKPGREIIESDAKRTAFLEEFSKFYSLEEFSKFYSS